MRQVMSFAHALRRKSFLALPLLGVTTLAFLAPTPAKGALVLTWNETQGPDVGAHGSMSDSSNTIDVNSAPFGDFSTNVNVGVSNLTTGSTQAVLQINSIDSTFQPSASGPFSGPVTLVITLTDNGFSFPGSSGSALNLVSAINSSTFVNSSAGDSASFSSIASDSGPGNTVSTAASTTSSPGGSSAIAGTGATDQSATFTRQASTYTLESILTLNFSTIGEQENVGGTTTTQIATGSVPEPTSLGALAIGGLLMLRRRSR
jgi:hypothetical protein